jgi:uncharacterized membrane protein AbrB (regulator of aidB expression)
VEVTLKVTILLYMILRSQVGAYWYFKKNLPHPSSALMIEPAGASEMLVLIY